jgi:hypothetical protein
MRKSVLLCAILLFAGSIVAGVVHQAQGQNAKAHTKHASSGADKMAAVKSRGACWTNMMTIAVAAQAYKDKGSKHVYPVRISALKDVIRHFNASEYRCPAGGRYTLQLHGDTYTVHCSIKDHDSHVPGGPGLTPDTWAKAGYTSIPRLATDVEAAITLPHVMTRSDCRANMQTISNAAWAYKQKHGKFPTSLRQLKEDHLSADLCMGNGCPSGGHYSVKLNGNYFTVHCTVEAHDKSTTVPTGGFTPGLDPN